MKKVLFFISIILACLADLFISHHDHAPFWWHKLPAFDALYGFIGGILLIIVAQALGRYWLQKDADYYD
ncbi:MAG: hypothetical protein A3G93_14000 [Nitrospinae bacterium RIFCSPLOWO2_12_FULL_45_22]|nr:MAG: hypothetical protein A3G93_14000 [Nitrospinae bacterium RIFCSPLOWO2_12_FULL_45_22]